LNKKIPYLAVNLIAPGLGQLYARKWLLGSLMLSAGILTTLWFTWEALYPLYRNIQNVLNDQEMDLKLFNCRNLILSPVLLVVIWVISYVELIMSKEKGQKPSE